MSGPQQFPQHTVVQDEMFPEGPGAWADVEESIHGVVMDLADNDRAVHLDFFNKFDDLFDDDDVS